MQKKAEISILALFAMRSTCWTWQISLKLCEIQKEKKTFGSHKYIRKSEHMLYFRWKKSEQQFFWIFSQFWSFGGNESNFEEFSEFHLFLIKFTLLLQNFFSKFPKKSSLLPKMAKINKKSLVNPMIFLVFESRNIHSRAESV